MQNLIAELKLFLRTMNKVGCNGIMLFMPDLKVNKIILTAVNRLLDPSCRFEMFMLSGGWML